MASHLNAAHQNLLFLPNRTLPSKAAKHPSCSHAIYTVREFVDRHVLTGCTVNLCAIDLSKAFDKVNHNALFIKLMERHIPYELIEILENLFHCCHSFVKWHGHQLSKLVLVSGKRILA